MANLEKSEPTPPRKKARGKARAEGSTLNADPPPSKPSLTDRLENARNEHLRSLEVDKQRLEGKLDNLQAVVDRLGPENARLREAHANAVVNNILATIFVAVGGGAISFATFVEGASKSVAWVGAALLGSGVVILILATLQVRSTKPAVPS